MHHNSAPLVIAIASLVSHGASSASAATNSYAQELRADAAARAIEAPSHGQAAFGIVPEGQEGTPNFTFLVLLPVLYDSNPEATEVGGTPAAEYNPELRVAWQQAFPHQLTLSALADVNSDRYARAHDANSDAAYGRFRIQHVSGWDDQEMQPFVEYSPRLQLTPFFSGPTSTDHDLRVGVDKTFNYQDAFHTRAIRKGNSSDETVWALTYTIDIWRRHTNAGPDSTRLEVDPTLSWYPLGAPWNASLEVDVLPTWYDKQADSRRHDTATTAVMTLEYYPSWLPKQAKLDFQVVFARVDSTHPNSSFQQWAVGPMIKVSTPL